MPVATVEGEKELRRTLKQAGDDMADLKAAHGEVAGIVVPAAQAGVRYLNGNLSASVRGSGTKTAAIVRAGGAKVPYANVQEWGWPRHNISASNAVGNAARMTEPQWTERYTAAIDGILAKIRGA